MSMRKLWLALKHRPHEVADTATMTKHIIAERSDGNGTPAGLRVSYAAMGVIFGGFNLSLALILGVAGFVRTADIRSIDLKIEKQSVEISGNKALMEAKIQEVRGEVEQNREERMAQLASIQTQLNRIEDKVNRR